MKTSHLQSLIIGFSYLFLSGSAFAALPTSFNLKDVVTNQNVQVDLSAANMNVFLFMSAKCPCSKSHESKIKGLEQKYSKQGFKFYIINSNTDEELKDVKQHFEALKLNIPVLKDGSAKIANQFGALKTPHAFITRGNKILYQGGVDDSSEAEYATKEYLANALGAIAKGSAPAEAETRALGCVIKR